MLPVLKRICLFAAATALALSLVAAISEGLDGLSYGDKSEAVLAMQERLDELGFFQSEATGYYGDATKTAVKNFQKANGLESTGVADEATVSAMKASAAVTKSQYLERVAKEESQSLSQGMEGEAVKKLQERLIELGYAEGAPSGKFGNVTREAVALFQKANGLDSTGIADEATISKLKSSSAITLAEHKAGTTQATQKPAADSVTALKTGDTGRLVTVLQDYLSEYGYYAYDSDGVFDSDVEYAVRRFQRANSIEETGVVDYAMRDLLTGGKAVYDPDYIGVMSYSECKYGDSGLAVKLLQTRLKELGYYTGSIDGQFSTSTQTAVAIFQSAHGIEATGAADVATRRKMNSAEALSRAATQAIRSFEGVRTLKYGSSGDDVTTIQTFLNTLGYYTGEMDGVFGSKMLKAVKLFQEANGLAVTGEIDSETASMIMNSGAISLTEYQPVDSEALAMGEGSREARIESICRLALTKLDAGYEYSGYGPDAFDCSGFTYYLYKSIGITLPRSSAAQAEAGARKLTLDEISRGDILCFYENGDSDTGVCGHVGLYLGNGQFVHASSDAGLVLVSSITSGYYEEAFAWGVRPLA